MIAGIPRIDDEGFELAPRSAPRPKARMQRCQQLASRRLCALGDQRVRDPPRRRFNLSCKSEGVGTRCGPKRSSKEDWTISGLDILEGGLGVVAGTEGMIVLIIEVRKVGAMSVMHQLSAFVAREFSAMFAACSGEGDAADERVWEVFVVRSEEAASIAI